MNNSNITKENKDIKTSVNDIDDQCRIRWVGGFFDCKGNVSLAQTKPLIQILNANPKAAMIIYSLLKRNNIEVRISERSKPSKSSKKKRWDLFSEGEAAIQLAQFLSNYVFGKREQLEFIIKNKDKCELQYLNQTNNILILNNVKLFEKIRIKKYDHETINESTKRINVNNFCDLDWLCGVTDAVGVFEINSRDKKGKDAAKFTPRFFIKHHNKKIMNNVASSLKQYKIGYHISFKVSESQNCGKWILEIAGLKRIKFLLFYILDKLIIKKEHANLLNLYVHRRLKEDPKSIDELGYSTKSALESMGKSI